MTVQFALAFITVIVSAYLNSNNEHLLSLDWGYEPENTLVVQLQEEGQFELLRSELSQYPAFSKIAGGQNHIGQGLAATRINLEGIEQTVRSLSVGTGYFESMGIEIRSGRGFPQNREAEDRTSVVVNQAFADEYGWDDPLDRSFKLENTEFTVVGLIGNVMTNLVASNYPVFFQTSEIEDYSVATMLIATGSEKGAMEIIDDVWPKIFPGSPVDYFLQREIFDISFGSLKRLNQMFVAIAFLALFIACMGLFGLASQNVAARVKELAIRKSLGASDASLNIVLNRSFMMLLGLAAILTTPLCYFGINGLLGIVKSNNLVLGGSPFVIAYLVVLTTATMTVAIQARKIARLNPAEVLKSE